MAAFHLRLTKPRHLYPREKGERTAPIKLLRPTGPLPRQQTPEVPSPRFAAEGSQVFQTPTRKWSPGSMREGCATAMWFRAVLEQSSANFTLREKPRFHGECRPSAESQLQNEFVNSPGVPPPPNFVPEGCAVADQCLPVVCTFMPVCHNAIALAVWPDSLCQIPEEFPSDSPLQYSSPWFKVTLSR